MNDFTKKRFEYYREKSFEDLIQEKEKILNEINYLLELLASKEVSSEQKSEILNSDIKYEKEKLNFINILLNKNNTIKKINKIKKNRGE